MKKKLEKENQRAKESEDDSSSVQSNESESEKNIRDRTLHGGGQNEWLFDGLRHFSYRATHLIAV